LKFRVRYRTKCQPKRGAEQAGAERHGTPWWANPYQV
jgi:hypothetical protein